MTIKEFRLSQKLSQPKLAAALGIGVSTIGGYETGRINPSAKVIEKIKEVYGVDLNAPEAPARKTRKPRAKKAEAAPAVEPVEKKAPRARKAAKKPAEVIIQSPMGGEITPEAILEKVGEVDRVYVRVDQNTVYWVKGEESGAVNLW